MSARNLVCWGAPPPGSRSALAHPPVLGALARAPFQWLLPVLAAWSCAVGSASAQTGRAVVLRFEGWYASQAREAVVEALAPELHLVTEDQAVDAARELGVDVSTPDGMADVVRHLGITLVVGGSVEGRMRSAQTTVMILDPAGNELARRTGPSPFRRQDRAAIGASAVEALNEALAVLERQRQPPVAPTPAPIERAPEPVPPPEPAWRARQLVILAGLRVRTVGTYVDDANGRLHFFEADAYPEIDLELAYRPWASAADSLRGVFFGVQGSFSVGIGYIASAGDQRGMTSLRFRFDVGYAHVLGDIFEIAGIIGFGIEGVQLDAPDGFPSTLFSFLRPALAARVRAVGELLMVEASLGGRIGLDGGPLASAFGPGFFFGGVDLSIGLTGIVEPGFTWAARLGYIHHGMSFSGIGGSFGRGLGGTDQAVEGRFLVGWAL